MTIFLRMGSGYFSFFLTLAETIQSLGSKVSNPTKTKECSYNVMIFMRSDI